MSEKRQHRWIDDSGEEYMVDSEGGYFIRERPSGFWAVVSETRDFEALADEILRLADWVDKLTGETAERATP